MHEWPTQVTDRRFSQQCFHTKHASSGPHGDDELGRELEARGAPKTARDKKTLRLRLRALMIRAALDARREEEGG